MVAELIREIRLCGGNVVADPIMDSVSFSQKLVRAGWPPPSACNSTSTGASAGSGLGCGSTTVSAVDLDSSAARPPNARPPEGEVALTSGRDSPSREPLSELGRRFGSIVALSALPDTLPEQSGESLVASIVTPAHMTKVLGETSWRTEELAAATGCADADAEQQPCGTILLGRSRIPVVLTPWGSATERCLLGLKETHLCALTEQLPPRGERSIGTRHPASGESARCALGVTTLPGRACGGESAR